MFEDVRVTGGTFASLGRFVLMEMAVRKPFLEQHRLGDVTIFVRL